MNKKSWIFLVLISLFLMTALAGCAGEEQQPTIATVAQAEQTEPTEPAAEETEAAAPAATEEVVLDPNVVVVSTPYGNLYYQEQWAEFMKVVQLTEGEKLTVSFSAEINGMDYPLFLLEIGEAAGDPVGTLTDAQGVQRNVYLTVEENMEHTQLPQDEQNRLYAMQEEINYVLENLK